MGTYPANLYCWILLGILTNPEKIKTAEKWGRLGPIDHPKQHRGKMIVHIFRDLPEDQHESMENYADCLVEALSKEFSDQCKVRQFYPRKIGLPSSVYRFTGIAKLSNYYSRFVDYPHRAKRRQGDVNHIVDHGYAHLLYSLDARRTVVTCHDLIFLKTLKGDLDLPRGTWIGTLFGRYVLAALPRAGRVIADSENTRRDILRYTRCEPGKIRVIYPGINPEFRVVYDQSELDEARTCYHMPQGKKYVLHVGTSGLYKNVQTVVRAFAALVHEASADVYLVKVGAAFTPDQEALATLLGIKDKLIYLGKVSRSGLCLIYNLADILVFPSVYEGFGWPPLEAMACGTPVVVSNTPALLESAGDAAIVAEPFNHVAIAQEIKRLLFDSELRRRQIEKGLERAKTFTWEESVKQIFQVYLEVAEEQGSS